MDDQRTEISMTRARSERNIRARSILTELGGPMAYGKHGHWTDLRFVLQAAKLDLYFDTHTFVHPQVGWVSNELLDDWKPL